MNLKELIFGFLIGFFMGMCYLIYLNFTDYSINTYLTSIVSVIFTLIYWFYVEIKKIKEEK